MAGSITKGMKLSYSSDGSSYTALAGLQEFPDMGGNKDSVEVTTFDDSAHVYRNGIDNYGDSISFTFLHNATQFTTMAAWTGEMFWKLEIPDGTNDAIDTTATWKGQPSVQLAGKGINEALTDVLNITPTTAITFA